MEQVTTISLISVGAATFGAVLGYLGYSRIAKKDTYAAGTEKGILQADVTYIKVRIDDVLKKQEDMNKNMNTLDQRVTRVEESTKSAHRRIDEHVLEEKR